LGKNARKPQGDFFYSHCISLKSTFIGLQFCRRHYGFIFIHLAIVAFQNRDITRKSHKIWPYGSSRSSKVIDLGVNRYVICDVPMSH